MELFSETKRRDDDPPKKKRNSSCNDAIQYLQEKADKDYEIQKQELELKNHDEMIMQQQQDTMRQFQHQQ